MTDRQKDRQFWHKSRFNTRLAFTLAEILIVLTIIGIVASLTIPDLLYSIQESQTKVQLKKFYSIMSQATYNVVDEHNGTLVGLLASGYSSNSLIKNYYPYLNIAKRCTHSNTYGNCWHDHNTYSYASGNPATLASSVPAIGVALADGTLVIFQDVYLNCTGLPAGGSPINDICDWVTVDLNGFKKPNTYGKDIFRFYITKDRFLSRGMQGDYMPECMYGTQNFCPAHLLLE